MTSELSHFAARLRTLIADRDWSPVAAPQRGSDGSNLLGVFPVQFPATGDDPHSDAPFNSLALELFALHFEHNAACRKFSEARGVTPRLVSHWSQIPAVPAAAFKELDLTCLPPARRARVFHSSGTTKHRPGRHFHNEESLGVYEASLWSWFKPHVLSDLRSTAADWEPALLVPPPEQAPHSSLVHMFETVRREVGAPPTAFLGSMANDGSWSVNLEAAHRLLQDACHEARPLVLLGAAFSFVHLLDYLAGHGARLQLPAGSRVMETGGYKGRSRSLPKAELHRLITERLGIPSSRIVCEYGMSELSSQAYDRLVGPAGDSPPHPEPPVCNADFRVGACAGWKTGVTDRRCLAGATSSESPDPDNRRFHFPPWARVQVISPETGGEVAEGETGLIRVFDLANVFSVMAIQTEDLGIRRGDGFELIGRAELSEPRGCSLMAV